MHGHTFDEAFLLGVDADDGLRSALLGGRGDAKADSAQSPDGHRGVSGDVGRVKRGAVAGREGAAQQAGALQGGVGVNLDAGKQTTLSRLIWGTGTPQCTR